MTYTLIVNDTFLNQLLALPRGIGNQVQTKLKHLQEDPISAGGDAKKLKGENQRLYRVRVSDYRLIYTFKSKWVNCLAIGHRRDIYRKLHIPDSEVPEEDIDVIRLAEPPGLLNEEVLRNCFIPEEYWEQLLAIKSEDKLLYLDIPEKIIQKVLDILYPPSWETLEQKPEKLLTNPDDLTSFFQGEITPFLLRLDKEQKRICRYRLGSPVLMKGGPGTGKTIIAVYRVQKLLENGCQSILFTAHSSALITYSSKLLEQLLGTEPESKGITVNTVGSLIYSYFLGRMGAPSIPSQEKFLHDLKKAFNDVKGNKLGDFGDFEWKGLIEIIFDRGFSDLLREIQEVIESCGLRTEAEYLKFNTSERINRREKPIIWAVYQRFKEILKQQGLATQEHYKFEALKLAQHDEHIQRYDALIIDEAQDICPVSLDFILCMIRNRRKILLTADSSQSIYKRGFDWSQVHNSLKGSLLSLDNNFRNTKEIAAACRTILQGEDIYQPCKRKGEIPKIYFSDTEADEDQKIAKFFKDSARNYRIPLTGAAIICPNIAIAHKYEERMNHTGLKAKYVEGCNININSPYIKIITMDASKGLEFAFVAVVGLKEGIFPESNSDNLKQLKRLFFVACSRAMYNLGVFADYSHPSRLINNLEKPYWDRERGN
ncbi:3'-5' exonuclease [Gloeocapsa sp. PCC 73106]|uniref:3'-5' exonuclease n=1 Tax=Gloeocapsa sp. PCC 73106 TaxID=102232 RepID=UPI0002AC49AB|nr:3'-5' exonuclease [Gloeocapsa sp. PCC 73106]ELR96710.1 DNA/RNA helicase, superfamily I [Gloeocapsa sp. PCC 73106]